MVKKNFSPNIWQMMTFLNPLDALIPKIPVSFFAGFWVTSEARVSVSVGFWGSRQLSLFGGGGGLARGLYRPPPRSLESPVAPGVAATTPVPLGGVGLPGRCVRSVGPVPRHGRERRGVRGVCGGGTRGGGGGVIRARRAGVRGLGNNWKNGSGTEWDVTPLFTHPPPPSPQSNGWTTNPRPPATPPSHVLLSTPHRAPHHREPPSLPPHRTSIPCTRHHHGP